MQTLHTNYTSRPQIFKLVAVSIFTQRCAYGLCPYLDNLTKLYCCSATISTLVIGNEA